MATRAELITAVSQYSDAILEKLITIGDSILSPMDTELTSVDFASMIDQVFRENGLADRYFPKWTDRSTSDMGRFLVELFAIFSDKDFFYANHFADESFVGKAELYRSIFHKALNEGFNPPSNIAAAGPVELIFSEGAQELVPRGAIVLGLSTFEGSLYSNEEFVIPASTIDQPVTVTFRHGQVKQDQGFFDGHSIRLNYEHVVAGSEVLIILGEEWTQVETFYNTGASDKVYMVVYDEEGKPELLFAKTGFGARPAVDVLWEVEFTQGGGYIGDIQANTLDLVVNSETIRNLTQFTQFEISGGNVQLPLEKLRQTVIGKKRTQDRVVTPEDAQYFLQGLEFVVKSNTMAFQNYLYIYAVPTGGGNLSPSQISLIDAQFTPQNLMMGVSTAISSAQYVAIKMTLDLYIGPKTPKAGAYTVATQLIQEFLDPLVNGYFGQGVERSAISSLLLGRVRGATQTVFQVLHRLNNPQPINDLIFSGAEVVDYTNSSITVNVIGGI